MSYGLLSSPNRPNSKKIGFQDLEELQNMSIKEKSLKSSQFIKTKLGESSMRALKKQLSKAAFSNLNMENKNKFQSTLDILANINKLGIK